MVGLITKQIMKENKYSYLSQEQVLEVCKLINRIG